jgi:2,3-bisphosphoglycerate-dependent phosphoglycerate mutase
VARNPRGTRLVLVRHGQAGCNVAGVVGGPRGCTGLTDLGRAQARALAQRLALTREFDDAVAAYSSVLPRAKETAQLVRAALPVSQVVEDCDLCELHPGLADAMEWDEMVATFGGPDWDVDPTQPFAPEGESRTGFYERCAAAFHRLASRHPTGVVLLFVHGGVVEQAMKLAMGAPAGGSSTPAHRALFVDRDRDRPGPGSSPALQRPRSARAHRPLKELGHVKGHVEAL